ncbi:MAG: hypothetical protein IJW40_00460, partial [Clostridia bacterium]|nr:hypothetical protein [Clostridia bacterium]
KHKFFALLLSACLLLAVLASCTTADNDVPTNDIPINDVPTNDVPINDVPTPDTAEPEIDATIDGSDPEEGVTPETENTTTEQQAYVINYTIFDNIDQLIAFNKNPALLNAGSPESTANLLSMHQKGTVLSRDYIYIPTKSDEAYRISGIIQDTGGIGFVYEPTADIAFEERMDGEIDIIFYYTKDSEIVDRDWTQLVNRYGESDEKDYIHVPSQRFMFRRLDDTCYMYLHLRSGIPDYQNMRSWCEVQKVNVNPDAVTE